jgi:hypothetical protein
MNIACRVDLPTEVGYIYAETVRRISLEEELKESRNKALIYRKHRIDRT